MMTLTYLWQNVAWKDQGVSQSKDAAYPRYQEETKKKKKKKKNTIEVNNSRNISSLPQVEVINLLKLTFQCLNKSIGNFR